MSVIYIDDWDFSVEQFAVTDTTSQWFCKVGDREFYKYNNEVTICGGFARYNSNWYAPFNVIVRGPNSIKSNEDCENAASLSWGISGSVFKGQNFVLPEYPECSFYMGYGFGLQDATISVREPLIMIDYNGESRTFIDMLRDVLKAAHFTPGRSTPIDPYTPGGNTEPGGGEGDFDNTSDPIPESSLPTLSAVDAKFISLYTPTLAELQSLASYMWSPLFDLDTLKKLFADPMKAILGLSIVPFTVPSSGQQAITIGNISTGVNMTKASAQYVQIDCGTLNVNEYWGAYLDYSPYTKLEIYLPYIGTKQISIDDVMNKACHVYYNIDILTGACCAMIKCDDSVLYSYAGQCATSIPITGNDWTNVVSGALSATLSSVGVIAGAVTGNAPATGMAGISLLSSASQNAMTMKPIIEKSGTIAGSAGMLCVQSPYLILTRPRQALPKDQNLYTGYPSYINMKLGDLAGMTFVEQVHLENIPCTSAEQSEIEMLLKGGVIF